MRFRNLEGLIDLPIDAVRHRFRNEPVLTVLPVHGAITGRDTLLVAMPTDVAVITADPHRPDRWMTSLHSWERIGLGVIRSRSGIHRLNVYVETLTLEAELWGPMGERALRDFIVAAGAVPEILAAAT